MRLSRLTQGRDNNFNLIRAAAATGVLLSHSFALAIGTGDAEPFRENLGMTPGSIAVDIFFVTSGFLVGASLLIRKSVIEFLWARFLRIFPALFVVTLLTIFLLGPVFTVNPLGEYLTSRGVYIYLLKSSTLIGGVPDALPGVFESNPYGNAVNGSLWTLPHEVRMYAILAGLWLILSTFKQVRFTVFKYAILVSTALAGVALLANNYQGFYSGHFLRLFFMFFCGTSFYVLSHRIELYTPLAVVLALLLLASAWFDKATFFVVYLISIPYLLFYVAYVPSGFIRMFNRIGDYSYGTYIFAFPIQQSAAALIPGVSVPLMVLISFAATLVLAVLSWHVVEKRALGLKSHFVGHTRWILRFLLMPGWLRSLSCW